MSFSLFQRRRRWTLISFSGLSSILVVSVVISLFFNYFRAYAAISWTEVQPSGAADRSWWSVASDSDGSNLLTVVSSGRVYTSSNYGVNWTERQPGGNVNLQWAVAASDDDGSNLVAGVNNGRLYTSADSGVTWTERQPAGDLNKAWLSAASDSTGAHLIVGVNGGRLYTSADSGATWTERQPAGNIDTWWSGAVSMSSDGSRIIAGVNSARLYTSSDYGVTWTERQPAGNVNRNWISADSDADGSNLIAAVSPGRLYTSSDYGATWTERQPAGAVDKNWRTVASDSTGTFLLASVVPGRLYSSSDGGVTWTEQQPIGNVDANWRAIAVDADGSNLLAGAARLYTGVNGTPLAPTNIVISDVTKSSARVAWTDNSSDETGFVVQRSTDGVTYTTFTTTTANATSQVVTSLSANTAYWFRVASTNDSGTSSYLTMSGSSTTLSNTTPTTPASLSLTPLRDASGYVTVQTTLNDSDADALSVKVEYRSGTCVAYSGQATTTITGTVTATYGSSNIAVNNLASDSYQIAGVTTTPGANTISFSWNSPSNVPTANGQYCVFLTSNDGTASSAVASTTVILDNVSPTAPGALILSNSTTSTATLFFGAQTTETNFAEYKVFYKAGSSGVTTGDTGKTSSTDSNLGSRTFNGASTVSLSGLSPNVQYVANIWAYDTYSHSAPAATELTFYTLASVPGAPTVVGTSTDAVNLVINQNSNPSNTTYAICKTSDGLSCDSSGYVQSSGVLGASAQFQTYAAWGGANGIDISGLNSNASYRFMVKARNAESTETAFSAASTAAYTLAAQVSSASVADLTNTTTLQLSLSFVSSTPAQSGLKIEQDSSCDSSYDTTVYNNASANPSSPYVIDSGLTANTCYQFRFSSYNASGVVNSVSPATTAQITTPPAQVANVHTTNVEDTQITWAWNSVTGATYYDVYNSLLGVLLGTVSAPTLQYLNTGLTGNTAYSILVRARNSNGTGIASSAGTATTDASAPTGVTHSSQTASTITWTWDNGGQAGFYGRNKVDTTRNSDWILTNSWTETGLSANTQYTVQVKARNSENIDTAYSEASAYTSQNAPSSLSFSSVSATQITVTANGTFPNIGTGSAAIYFNNGAGTTQSVNDGTSWTNIGLTPNTQYSYSAYATNGDGDETSAATGSKYTLANTPGTPTATSTATSSLTLIISLNSNPTATDFSICRTLDEATCAASGNLQANGTLSSSAAAWQSYTQWGGSAGITISGLTPAQSYQFLVKARNGESVETSYSTASAVVYTRAMPPAAPTVTAVSQTVLNLLINTNGNATTTLYSICKTADGSTCQSGGYIQSDGSSSSNSDSWQTFANWGGDSGQSIINLTANTAYRFLVKSKNTVGVESDFSNASSWAHTSVIDEAILTSSALTVAEPARPTVVVDGDPQNGLSRTVSQVSVPPTIGETTAVKIDLSRALSNQQVTVASALTVSRQIAGDGTFSLYIPDSTTITAASSDWNGQITVPTSLSDASIVRPKGSVKKVIEVGFTGVQLNFDNPVKLTFPGQGSNRAAYQRDGGESVDITLECAGVDNASNIIGSGECYKQSDSDLVVWTKHFTTYYTYSGNGGVALQPQPVFFTRQVPVGNIITVNNGAQETDNRTVIIDMNIVGAKSLAISNNSDFLHASFVPFKNKFYWTLPAGDGLKTIYVRFRDKNGGTADAFADIVLRESKKENVQVNKANQNVSSPTSGLKFNPVKGLLAKSVGEPNVYLFFGDMWHHIVSESVFKALEYSWEWIQTFSTEEIQSYPAGLDVTSSKQDGLPSLKEVQEASGQASAVVSATTTVQTAPTPDKGVVKFMFEKDLKPGQRGSEVEALQKKLLDLGYYKGKVTGFYGLQTSNAVKAFQKANKISSTGIFGSVTRAALNTY